MSEIELFLHLTESKQKTVLMLNWIVRNRIVSMSKMVLAINSLQYLICHKTKPNQNDQYIYNLFDHF